MTTRVIQCLKDDGLACEWQDVPVPFTEDIWDRIKNLKDGCKPIALRVIERETTETVVEMNAEAQRHEQRAETIEALDSGDEE